jgi:DNA mismatch endonuclease (patch repair protein)
MAARPSTPPASTPEIRARMQRTRTRDTPGEVALRKLLHARGYRYRIDQPLPGLRRRADLVFARDRLAVFVDGCFWHACPIHATWPKTNGDWWRAKILGNVFRDRDTDRRLADLDWTVVRVWEHEDPGLAADRVEVELVRVRARRAAGTER